jgi:hypothetical protein
VTPKRYYTLMMDPELIDALKLAKERSPELSEAAIIRQALRDWFDKHGVAVKKARPRKRTPVSKSK